MEHTSLKLMSFGTILKSIQLLMLRHSLASRLGHGSANYEEGGRLNWKEQCNNYYEHKSSNFIVFPNFGFKFESELTIW